MEQAFDLFTKDDILEAIENCDFNKGIGPDGFNGQVLNINNDLKQKVGVDLAHCLNTIDIPTHILRGRYVPLSKGGKGQNPSI